MVPPWKTRAMIDKLPDPLRLTRCNPDLNMARFYVIALEPTLFGEVAVVRSWGADRKPRAIDDGDVRRGVRTRMPRPTGLGGSSGGAAMRKPRRGHD